MRTDIQRWPFREPVPAEREGARVSATAQSEGDLAWLVTDFSDVMRDVGPSVRGVRDVLPLAFNARFPRYLSAPTCSPRGRQSFEPRRRWPLVSFPSGQCPDAVEMRPGCSWSLRSPRSSIAVLRRGKCDLGSRRYEIEPARERVLGASLTPASLA